MLISRQISSCSIKQIIIFLRIMRGRASRTVRRRTKKEKGEVDNGRETIYFEGEDGMNMAKSMRAKDIVSRFINARPDYESCEAFCRRIGLPTTLTIEKLRVRRDITTGLLYQLCKAFGYQIMIFNPDPPEGLEKCYIIDKKYCPVRPREERQSRLHVTRDSYTNEIFRATRKYKRHKKTMKKVE